MKIGFLLYEQWHQAPHTGSSKVRGHWLIRYWNEAEPFEQGKKYDVVIFQKTYWKEYVREYRGIKILDICDPDWLIGVPVKEIIDNCDAVSVSNEELKKEIEKFTDKPVIFIPDRVDLGFYNVQKKHEGPAKKVVWFGYSGNSCTLDRTLGLLTKFDLKLTVISNQRPPYMRADENVKFDNANPSFDFNKAMLKNDIALLPIDIRPRGRFKSQNKTYIAWALGLPVATTPDELKKFLDPEERKKESEIRLKEIRAKWDIKLSVKQFKELIEQIKNGNTR